MRRLFSALFWFFAALVVLFEEWLWEPIRRLMARIALLPLMRTLSAAICRLPPGWAAALFLLPVLALIPFKIGGLWLIAHGKLGLGLTVFLGAKIVGTALLAWLFSLTKPTLLTLPWFAAAYAWVLDIRATVHRWLHHQRAYRAVRYVLRRLRRRIVSRWARP